MLVLPNHRAAAASHRARVTIIDDNPHLGGQIWRAALSKIKSPAAAKLVERIDAKGIEIVGDTSIFAVVDDHSLLALSPNGRTEFSYDLLIIDTGGRERFLPFPGWTLPGVYGAGGLQSMVKGGLNVNNKRFVVAGSGPLLLAVADHLRSKGAKILAIAEQAPGTRVNRFALGLLRSPSKLAQAVSLRYRLRGIPYLTDCWVTSALGDNTMRELTLVRLGRSWTIKCDYLACGFHLVPNLELAALVGCEIEAGVVKVDQYQQTSIENVLCAGEPTGIGGVEAALIEGEIAGLAATGQTDRARGLFRARQKARRFGDALNMAFDLRPELKTLADDYTVVCRCEDIPFGRLTEYSSFRDAKLMTRCGMGPCQGRICGAATEFIFGWERPSVRPPIFPVKMEDL